MSNSIILSIFEKTSVAEINSLKLYEYENSFTDYFSNDTNSDINLQYLKWFDKSKIKEHNNSSLKEFRKWFSDYFFI